MAKKTDEKKLSELSSYGIDVPDAILDYFCDKMIDYGKWFDGADKELLKASIKEVIKTPTGRMAFWTTLEDIRLQRQKDPDFKLKVDLHSDTQSYGYVDEREPNKIHINPNSIRDNYKGLNIPPEELEKIILFENAGTFFHEAQHTRQLRTSAFLGQYLASDAATQAFSRQLALEHPSKAYRDEYGISAAERKKWEKAVDYDPKTQKYDPIKAAQYSKKMQPLYTEDFIRSTDGKPNINHANLGTAWSYAKTDILYHTFAHIDQKFYPHDPAQTQKPVKMSKAAQEYLKTKNKTLVSRNMDFVNQVTAVTKPYADEFRKYCTRSDLNVLSDALYNNKELSREDFSSEEAYQAALDYQYVLDDLGDSFNNIAYYSAKIHGNTNAAEKKQFQKECAKELKYLKDNYGIVLSKTNKNNERVAQTEPTTGQGLSGALALSGDDITQGSAKTDSTQRSIAPQQNTRLT